jgi:dinuclear metal center YbgI/SA1388 family protein
MKISDIISFLESLAPPALQENYDNAGLITGHPDWECTGIICSLDTTEGVIQEATEKKCNLVVSHHPVIFGGLKKITGRDYVEKTVIKAIKHDIAIFAIHTNLDNVQKGVSGRMAAMLGLKNVSVLQPRSGTLKKLFTFAPADHAEQVRNAIFTAGGGHIGNYSECSFNAEGTGTFKGGEETNPYVGEKGKQHREKEVKIEIIFPDYLESSIVKALKAAHPYEEAAYDIIQLSNTHPAVGSGVLGELPEPLTEESFLVLLKEIFKTSIIRHSPLLKKQVTKVALCGGAGSFLIPTALAAGAGFLVSADMKYHQFFDANNSIVIADIGHYESEQFTIDLLKEILEQKFPTFAVLKTGIHTNPVRYF